MARNYYVPGFCTSHTSNPKTAVELVTTTAVRPKIYEIIMGSAATPASNASKWQFQRHTGTGTGTAFTPVKVDPADPTALVTAKVNNSAEPTSTANDIPFAISLNQQASFDWKANPGREIVLPASATAGGSVINLISTAATIYEASVYWEE